MFSPGCQKDDTTYIPEFSITADKNKGLTTDQIKFKINPEDNIPRNEKIHCRWDWNNDSVFDTKFSDDLEFRHRFFKPGEYNVLCQVLSISGGKKMKSIKIVIDQGYSAPVADFQISPETGHFMIDFLFDAGCTNDYEDSIETLRFRWDFEDDGIWDTQFSNETVINHTFGKTGVFKVILNVVDPSNRSGNITKTVIVHRRDTCIVPEFIWHSETGRVGDTFTFDAGASYYMDDTSKILNYKWFFPEAEYIGDTVEAVIEHKFRFPGPNIVRLVVEDGIGLQNSIEKELFIIDENTPPRPVLIAPIKYGNVETQFYLNTWESIDDFTPSSELLIRWDFDGDGSWDTGKSAEKEYYHQYASEGRYNCIMEIEDEEGLTATASKELWVSPHNNPTSFIRDRRDGKYYSTVKIGGQWWMSQNLDYRDEEKMDIPMFQKCYDEDDRMCDQFGSLYQSGRCISYIEEGNKICPEGWRIPNIDDIINLSVNIPENEPRNSLMVGGSLGFNARYTGFGSYVFVINQLGIITDTIYTYERFMEEVRFMTSTKRNSFPEISQYVYGIQRNYDGFNQMWKTIDGYYPIRCIKE